MHLRLSAARSCIVPSERRVMRGKVSKFHNVISCLDTPNTNKLRLVRISVPLCGEMPDQRLQRMTEQWCGEATLRCHYHYDDVIMSTIASQITSLTVVYSTVYSGADQSKHQSSASLAFVWGIHRGPVNSPHKWPVTRKKFPFDDVIMSWARHYILYDFPGVTTAGCIKIDRC